MTILWCGGEDIDFYTTTSTPVYSGGGCDTSFARVGIYESWSGSSYKLYSIGTFSPKTSLWAHCTSTRSFGTTSYKYIIGLLNSTNKYGIFVRIYDSTNLAIVKVDAAETLLVKQNADLYFGGKIDLQIINYGSNGTVNLYQNGVLVLFYTGDIRSTGVTALDMVGVGGHAENNISEIIVADEDTRLMRLKSLSPSAAGDSSTNWTGAYTDIDETSLSTVDKIYSTTDSADFQCNLTGMPTGTYSVKAVKTVINALDGTGVTGVQHGVKTNGTVSVGNTNNCTGYWTASENLMTVNPVTGLAWTPAEIDALQLNIRAKTL